MAAMACACLMSSLIAASFFSSWVDCVGKGASSTSILSSPAAFGWVADDEDATSRPSLVLRQLSSSCNCILMTSSVLACAAIEEQIGVAIAVHVEGALVVALRGALNLKELRHPHLYLSLRRRCDRRLDGDVSLN